MKGTMVKYDFSIGYLIKFYDIFEKSKTVCNCVKALL